MKTRTFNHRIRGERSSASAENLSSIQVTKFTCGGFAVGICFSHLVFDGQGAAQFLKAAGEMARGLPAPSVAPAWDRDAIPDPPKLDRKSVV